MNAEPAPKNLLLLFELSRNGYISLNVALQLLNTIHVKNCRKQQRVLKISRII